MAGRWEVERRSAEHRSREALDLLSKHGPLWAPQKGKGLGDGGLRVWIGEQSIAASTLRALVKRGKVRKVVMEDGVMYEVAR